ncbi:hypothetical protein ABEF95_016068 [Exophiala dermatitidis]
MSASSNAREKKVRSACQRCRERRVKCDGRTPSCSKCERAGVRCIDVVAVAGQENVPRGFVTDALSRLTWLENVVKTRLPDVDLSTGSLARTAETPAPIPPASLLRTTGSGEVGDDTTLNQLSRTAGSTAPAERVRTVGTGEGDETTLSNHLDPHPAGLAPPAKRLRTTSTGTGPDEGEGDSVSIQFDPGLISFHLAVPRLHYLGASSGNLFAHLLPGGPSTIQQRFQVPNTRDHDDPTAERDGDRKLLDDLRAVLPPRDECDRLVRLFFSHNHPVYPVLHEPSIVALIEALYASIATPNTCRLQHNGWPDTVVPFSYNGEVAHVDDKDVTPISTTTAAAILLSVLSIASYVQARRRRFPANPQRYEGKAFALTSLALAEISLPSTQLVVLSVMHGFLSQHSGNAWVLLHLGMAYAVDMGLHRDANPAERFSRVTVQMRRRTFFCLYRLDRFIGAIQGRPLGFPDDAFDLNFSSVLSDSIHTSPDADQDYLGYSILRFQWAQLVSEIRQHLYRSSPSLPEPTRSSLQADMLTRLDAWLDDGLRQMDALAVGQTRRFQTELQIDYYYAVGLLYQPSPGSPRPDIAALRRCFESAANRLRLFWSLYDEECLILSWLTAQGISLAGSTLAYCIWSSKEIRASVSITQLSADLRLCSSLLTVAGEWWPSARRGSRSFQRLANVTMDLMSYDKQYTRANDPTTWTHSGRANDAVDEVPFVPQTSGERGMENIEDIFNSFLHDDFHLPDMFGSFHTPFFEPPNDPIWEAQSYDA